MSTPVFSQAGTVLTQVRAETGIGASPKAESLKDTAMYQEMHDRNAEFVNAPYAHGMLGWKFLQRETVIQSKASTTLNGAVSSGASSILLTSGSDFDSPSSDVAAGYIKNANNIYDFFTYEGRSTHTLSTVAGVQLNHLTLEEVHKIYRLDSDFGKPRALYRQSNALEYGYFDSEHRQVPPHGYYMVKTLYGTNFNGSFLVLPEDVGEIDWKLYYCQCPSTIDESADRVQAPDGLGRSWLVEKMKSYVWRALLEYDVAAACDARAEQLLQRCLAEWATYTIQPSQSLSLHW